MGGVSLLEPGAQGGEVSALREPDNFRGTQRPERDEDMKTASRVAKSALRRDAPSCAPPPFPVRRSSLFELGFLRHLLPKPWHVTPGQDQEPRFP